MNYSRVAPQPKPAAPKVEPAVKPAPNLRPLADVDERDWLLPLPEWVESESSSVELCRIPVESPDECELGLRTIEMLGNEPRLQLARNVESPAGTRTWTVVSRTRNLDEFTETPVATFTWKDQALWFAWEPAAPAWSQPQGLRYCTLQIRAGKVETTCRLTEPLQVSVGQLSLGPSPTMPLELPAACPAPAGHIRVDLEISLQGASARLNQLRPGMNDPMKAVIPHAAKHGDGRVELEFRVAGVPAARGQSYVLSHLAFLYPTRLIEVPAPADSSETPTWRTVTQRIDRDVQFRRMLKNGFNRTDFARLEKFSEEQAFKLRKLSGNVESGGESQIGTAAGKSSGARKKDAAGIPAASNGPPFAQQRSLKDHQKEALEHSVEFSRWIDEMKRRFAEIEKHAEIRYSVSLDVGGEVVVLSETDPAPGVRKLATPAPMRENEGPAPFGLPPRKR